MKHVFKTVALMAATAGMLMNASCKKQEETSSKNDGASLSQQAVSKSELKVNLFLESYAAAKHGAKAEGEPVTLEEARWQWETTLNYCHGFTQDLLQNARLDTVMVALPKPDEQGNIAYSDLLQTYGNIVETVRDTYNAINLDEKTLQFVMVSLNDDLSKSGNDSLRVVMRTGTRSTKPEDPTPEPEPSPWYGPTFSYGNDWIWGLNLGKCDGSVTSSDAAQQLTEKVATYDVRNQAIYNPCPTCYTFIENPHIVQLYSNHNGAYDSIFYATGLTWDEVQSYCIPWTDMNQYYAWIMTNTHYPGMVINPYGYDWYYKVVVSEGMGKTQSALWSIWHDVFVWNCTRQWRKLNPNYPTPISQDTEE